MNISDLIDDPDFHDLDAVERAQQIRIRLRGCLYDHDVIALLCKMLYVERNARNPDPEKPCTPFSLEFAAPGAPSLKPKQLKRLPAAARNFSAAIPASSE